MFGDLFTGPHLIIVLIIVVLLFGATRLPALARALGQSRNAFKSEMKKGEEAGPSDSSTTSGSSTTSDSSAATEETNNTTPKP